MRAKVSAQGSSPANTDPKETQMTRNRHRPEDRPPHRPRRRPRLPRPGRRPGRRHGQGAGQVRRQAQPDRAALQLAARASPATAGNPARRSARWCSTKPTAAPTAASWRRARHDQEDPPDRRRSRQLPAADREGQAHDVRPTEARVVNDGPQIIYKGQTEAELRKRRLPGRVLPGRHPDQEGPAVALRGSITSMIRCSSGGDNTLIYTPPLFPGGPSSPPPTPTAAGC